MSDDDVSAQEITIIYRLTKLAADGTDLPNDATGHLAVSLDRPLLAQPLIWTAHRSDKRLT